MEPTKMILRTIEGGQRAFYCPGCKEAHVVSVNPGGWVLSGTEDKPTLNPSVLVRNGHYIDGRKGMECWCDYNKNNPDNPSDFKCSQCHSFIRDGQIEFLSDCTHELAGKTIPMEPF